MLYRNPVISGFHPDPSICRAGEDFYLVTSSFEYFPGVPLFHSKDLVHWEQIGHCLTRKSQLLLENTKSSSGIFAPTIRYRDGMFYMITTHNTTGKNFFVYTDNITGEWSEPLWLDDEGIDPSLFFDSDGRVYYTKTVFSDMLQAEIDIRTGKYLSEIKSVWKGSGGRYPEAPHLYRINNWYYLMLAEGGTEYGHMVTIARSESPWGPFEPCPRNPILTHRNRGTHPIQATGHADMVQDRKGNWWMVCLGIRPYGYPPVHHLGRETFLAPVTWSDEGWPLVSQNGTIEMEMDAELPVENYRALDEETCDDFKDTQLKHYWNFLRNPVEENYSLKKRPGYLSLTGSPVTLNDTGSPTFVGRRQKDFYFYATVLLEFSPAHPNEEAGLAVFMNERHHYEIGITGNGGKKILFVRKRIGDLVKITFSEKIEGDQIYLRIGGEKENYRFSFSINGTEFNAIETGEARYLSTEVAGGFTGVFIAMYATGNGIKSLTPAFFGRFDYKVLFII